MRYKNNPANIRYAAVNHWKGLEGSDNGFCQFESLELGCRALVVLLRGYIKKGYDTPEKIIKRFAPPVENDTFRYIRFVCGFISPNITPMSTIIYKSYTFNMLCSAICYFETLTHLSSFYFNDIIKNYKL